MSNEMRSAIITGIVGIADVLKQSAHLPDENYVLAVRRRFGNLRPVDFVEEVCRIMRIQCNGKDLPTMLHWESVIDTVTCRWDGDIPHSHGRQLFYDAMESHIKKHGSWCGYTSVESYNKERMTCLQGK